MQKVLIINPATPGKYLHKNRGKFDDFIEPLFKQFLDVNFSFHNGNICSLLPPITLLGLKALFEKFINVEIVDEQVTSLDYTSQVGLVCLTASTPQFPRAIKISKKFRSAGIPTAIGGVHATARPHDAYKHFDTVCIGEAEGYITELIEDLKSNKLKKKYKNRDIVNMENVPFYDYEIGDGNYLPVHVVSSSRGCNFCCDYCSISSIYGKYRARSPHKIIEEIQRVGAKYVWFPDATFTGDLKWTEELLELMVKQNFQWISQMTMNATKNEKLLDLMAESGCKMVSIGFESLSNINLKSANKTQNNSKNYMRVIEKLHKRGIGIEGNFMFGFDDDDEGVFERTSKFIVESKIDLPQIFVLTPYPDTPLFKTLDQQDRIVDKNWSHYDNMHFNYLPVFEPKKMSRETLRAGCKYVERTVFSIENTLKRLSETKKDHFLIHVGNYIMASRIYEIGRSDINPDCVNDERFDSRRVVPCGSNSNNTLISHGF